MSATLFYSICCNVKYQLPTFSFLSSLHYDIHCREQVSFYFFINPGRCPGLCYYALSGLENIIILYSLCSFVAITLQFSLHLIRVDSYYNPSFSCLSAVVRNGEGGCYGLLFLRAFTTLLF